MNLQDVELPDEVLEAISAYDEEGGEEGQPIDKLEDLAKILDKERVEAIAHRENEGIDGNFSASEEAYHGIDDMNRSEFMHTRWIKPTAMNAPVTTDQGTSIVPPGRSTAFVRLTTRYTDAGKAKVGEIILADKTFSIEPTPLPDLVHEKFDSTQVTDEMGRPMFRESRSTEQAAMAVPHGAPNLMPVQRPPSQEEQATLTTSADPNQFQNPKPLTKGDLAIQKLAYAKEAARRAETRIWDWWIECNHVHEMRKVLFDAARLGVGVIKGPFPQKRRSIALTVKEDGTREIKFVERTVPVHAQVDPWNIFPASNCGEHIRDGDYLWERDYMTEVSVTGLIGLPGYNTKQIEKVLKAGPKDAAKVNYRNPNETDQKNIYETWHRYGMIRKDHFEALNPETFKKEAEYFKGRTSVFAIVTIINDIPVRGSLHYLESEKIPYHNIPWQRRAGSWVGVGIPEQMSVPQRITNASVRAMLNNAGISAGPQIVINKEGIHPADGDLTLVPNKVWYLTNDGTINDVQKAFFSFDISNVTPQMMKIVDLGLRLAEESTNIPLVTQGQSGNTTPETYGATQLQDNNANQLLRDIAATVDGYGTEPLVRDYYEYLLLDPNVPQEEKGDYKISAKGSRALVDRYIADQMILQMGPYVLNPAYGINPRKWFAMMLKTKNLNPDDFQYSPEEQAEIDSRPPEVAPAVQVAQINAQLKQAELQLKAQNAEKDRQMELQIAQIDAETEMAATKLEQETAQLKVKMDTDRDAVYVQAEMQRSQATYDAKLKELALKKEILAMQLAHQQKISVDQAKVRLADTSMKLKVQKELTALQQSADMKKHTTPTPAEVSKASAEIPGKAKPGKAFTQ